MSEKQRILLVDDDPNISHLVRLYLEKEGFDVTESARGDEALEAFRRESPALVLLDVMLPGMDGLQVLKEIRKTSKVPVIMLTARDETFDKVLGLELGADDYVTKPFETKELVARVKAVLRRAPAESAPASDDADDTLRYPGLTVSLALLRGDIRRPRAGDAAQGAGSAVLPRLSSQYGLYPRAAVGARVGI